jgi:hypothetical protein
MSINPPGSGGFLHTHTPVDTSTGSNPGAPSYPNPPYASVPEWPTVAAAGALTITVVPAAGSITATTATITWTTNRASDGTVLYGTTTGYGSQKGSGAPVTSHSVLLTGLTTATLYNYRAYSTDGINNVSSANATFTTA